MPTPEINPIPALRQLLSRRATPMLAAAAPELVRAFPLLVVFFERYERLEARVLELEQLAVIDAAHSLVTARALR